MQKFEFNCRAVGFDLLNAMCLAELSALAYRPLGEVGQYLRDENGFTQFQPFDVRDTRAFLAANDAVVVLIFRGAVSMDQWMADLQVRLVPSRSSRVHFGFNQALDDIWYDLYDAVCTMKGAAQTLWVAGHGFGGALATLAVDHLTDAGVEVDGLYTYGQPRVGDKEFVSTFDRKMGRVTFRLVSDDDPVTRVPSSVEYRHVGIPYYFDSQGKLYSENNLKRWWKGVAQNFVVRKEKDAATLHSGNPDILSEHSLNYYLKCLRQAWERQSLRKG